MGVVTVRKFFPLIFVFLWALWGMAQYGPGEGGYMSFRFEGQVVGAVSCEHRGTDTLRCRVREGTSGHVELRAAVNPPAPLEIRLLSAPPGWPGLPVASGYGTASAEYRFALPRGSAGRRFEFVFGAFREGALVSSLTVILEVEWPPSPFPVTTVPVYVTDREGRFTIPVGELSDTVVRGTIACDGKPKSGVQVSAKLIPREGRGSIRTLTDVGGVELSSPDFGTIKIPRERLRFSSSFDITGRIQRTIDVGTVCPQSVSVPVMPLPIVEITWGSVKGTTDSQGKFEVPMPGNSEEKIWGRIVDCATGRPLKNQDFSLEPIYTGGKITGFEISSPDFPPEIVTRYTRVDFSFFGRRGFHLGDVRVSTKTKRELERELDRIRNGFFDDREFREEYEKNDQDPRRAVLALGRYLAGKCFRVEVSRGELTVESGGEIRKFEWVLLVVHIGDKVYLVEATRLPDFGTPKAVGLIAEAKRARVFVQWVVLDPEYEVEGKVKGYEEKERLSLDEYEKTLGE